MALAKTAVLLVLALSIITTMASCKCENHKVADSAEYLSTTLRFESNNKSDNAMRVNQADLDQSHNLNYLESAKAKQVGSVVTSNGGHASVPVELILFIATLLIFLLFKSSVIIYMFIGFFIMIFVFMALN